MEGSSLAFKKTSGHSQNLLLSEDGRCASRSKPDSVFKNAFAVLHPPLRGSSSSEGAGDDSRSSLSCAEETPLYFEVVVRRVRKGWAGGLKMRFVVDPEETPNFSRNEPLDINHPLEEGDRVGLLCDAMGRSHYVVNGKYLCPIEFIAPVDLRARAIYGLVDVYANTEEVAIAEDALVGNEWSPQSHKLFPRRFREQVFALLCCHRSPNAVAINTLPKWVLLDIIGILATQFHGFRIPDGVLELCVALPPSYDPRVDLPSHLRNCIHPIRNQHVESCGSCWAFASSGVMSDRICLATNGTEDVVLSPQWMVDCDRSNSGCSGGTPENVYTALQAFGTVPDECSTYQTAFFPTNCTSGRCPSTGAVPQFFFMKQVYRVPPNEETIMAELMERGPISALMNVFTDFHQYSGGVYTPGADAQYETGHFVRLIGWGVEESTSTPYWLVANSFGTSWGEDGFFRIKRGACAFEVNLVTGIPRTTTDPVPPPAVPLGSAENNVIGHMDLVLDVGTTVLHVGMSASAACRWQQDGARLRRFDLYPEGATHPTTVVVDYSKTRMYVLTTLFEARRCNYVPKITGSLATVDYLLPQDSTFLGYAQEGHSSEVMTTVSRWAYTGEAGHNRTFSVKVRGDGRAIPVAMHDTAGMYTWTFTAQTVSGTADLSLFDLSAETCNEVPDEMSAGISPPIRAFMDALTVGFGCSSPESPSTLSSAEAPVDAGSSSSSAAQQTVVSTSSAPSTRPLSLGAVVAISILGTFVVTAAAAAGIAFFISSRHKHTRSTGTLETQLLGSRP